jgi:hypothetical protein
VIGRCEDEIPLNWPARQAAGRPKKAAAPAAPRIPRITRLMALAIKFQQMIDRGEVKDYADFAPLGLRDASAGHADHESHAAGDVTLPRPPARKARTEDALHGRATGRRDPRARSRNRPSTAKATARCGRACASRRCAHTLRRVLRLMREHQLLAPQRQPQPVEPKRHEGTILAEQPNQMWGIDATADFTLAGGPVPIFAMIDHHSAFCLGIHVAKRGTRFEALEPVRQAVREQFGGFWEGVALGVKLRHDHGSQFMSDDFQIEIRFLGLESSPAFGKRPMNLSITHKSGTE